MNDQNLEKQNDSTSDPAPFTQSYEAPHVESVLTPEELEREVLYAGNVISSDTHSPP